MRTNIVYFVTFLLSSCSFTSSNKVLSHAYYSDLDIFTMSGKNPIKGDKPVAPCFEVDSIGPNEVRIGNWYPKIGLESRDYHKRNDYWSTNFKLNADTVDLMVYQYIGNGKIISLEYLNDDSVSGKLKTAKYYEDSLELTYLFRSYYQFSPSPDVNFEAFNDSIPEEKIVRKFHIENGTLRVVKKTSSSGNSNIESDTSYYKIGINSIFWWMEFGR